MIASVTHTKLEVNTGAHIRNSNSLPAPGLMSFVTAAEHSSLRAGDGTQEQLLQGHRDTREFRAHLTQPQAGLGETPASLSVLLPCFFHWYTGTSLFCRLLRHNHNFKWCWTFHMTIQTVQHGWQMPHLLHVQGLCKQHWSSRFSYPILFSSPRKNSEHNHVITSVWHVRTPAGTPQNAACPLPHPMHKTGIGFSPPPECCKISLKSHVCASLN